MKIDASSGCLSRWLKLSIFFEKKKKNACMSIRVFMHAYVRVRSRFRSSTIVPGSNEILREPGKQIAASNEDYISSDLIKVTELT